MGTTRRKLTFAAIGVVAIVAHTFGVVFSVRMLAVYDGLFAPLLRDGLGSALHDLLRQMRLDRDLDLSRFAVFVVLFALFLSHKKTAIRLLVGCHRSILAEIE